MKKRILALALCILCLTGCSKGNMKDLYNTNTLSKLFKEYSSITLTTTFADGSKLTRFYQPNFAFFDFGDKQTVYLSSGCYSYSDERFYTEIFTNEDYSFHMLKERFTAPVVAQNAKVSTVLESEKDDDTITYITKPTEAYKKLLYEEYGVEEGSFKLIYVMEKSTKKLISEKVVLDGEVFAEIAVTYDLPRPAIADDLYSRLTAPANQCRTIKVTLDYGSSKQKTVIAHSLKGDGFKLDPPEGYNGAYANPYCTKPYASKGSDVDAEIYLMEGR